jgi:DNA-directed RNA polymerase specialized sigma24 family protein
MAEIKCSDLRRRVLSADWIDAYADCISRLRPRYRLLFAMYFIHGYTQYEIADLCGVCEGSIQRRIRTCIRKIERLRNQKPAPDGLMRAAASQREKRLAAMPD